MPELSGRFDENGVHRYPLRVYYEDTDAGNIVYHANYLRFMERARTEMLRLMGWHHTGLLADQGVSFAVRRCEIDFIAPAKLDDTLEVETRITDIGGASFAVDQTIRRDGKELARADLKLATLNRAGRPARLGAEVRTALKELYERQMRNDPGRSER
ncbi:tol-pal system-associated acyl-CoA thioesterase [Azospirillum sp.]|uniref:tol-pal system-associated acyl-CoA thioesterase n=1 Tax=Azospirillum sp. TaxID=34012 RepID=UPI003D7305AA